MTKQPEDGIKSRFQIADWMVDPSLNRLENDGMSVRIEPRLMKLLCLLAEHAGNAVTKDMIFDTVWPNVYVGEESLSKAISELRRILGDDRASPRYIETVWKSGYRLIPAAVPVPEEAAGNAPKPRNRLIMIGITLTVLLAAAIWIANIRTLEQFGPVRPLTSYVGAEQSPALSPDGILTAFSWQEPESAFRHIYLISPGSDEYRQLTDGNANHFNPVFSPDGASVAFYRNSPDSLCHIVVKSLNDGAETPVFTCDPGDYPDLAWSPDGKKLAFGHKENDSAPHAIHVLDLGSGNVQKMTNPAPTLWGDYDPVFASDSKSIVFVRAFSEAMQDLYLLDGESGAETRLTSDIRNILGTVWDYSSDTVVFASNRHGLYGLWRMAPRSDARIFPVVMGDEARNPAISYDGKTLLFESTDNDVDFYSREVEGPDRIWAKGSSTYYELHPDISPDGTRVIFASNRSGAYEIWMADRDGGNARQLTNFNGPFVAHPKWSPDGAAIAFDARPGGNIDLFTIRADGTGQRQLTSSAQNNHGPSWSRNGKSLIFGSDRDGGWSLWRYDLATGRSSRLLGDNAFFGQESPDGSAIYYAKFAEPGLWRRSTETGAEEMITDALHTVDWGNWGFAGKELFYVARSGNAASLVIGSRHLPLSGALPQIDPGITISRDGQYILYARFTRTDSDLMIAERQ